MPLCKGEALIWSCKAMIVSPTLEKYPLSALAIPLRRQVSQPVVAIKKAPQYLTARRRLAAILQYIADKIAFGNGCDPE